jgi:two-component system, OmpR family, sensor kinase
VTERAPRSGSRPPRPGWDERHREWHERWGRRGRPHRLGGRRFFWRVFLHGLLLIGLVTAAVAGVSAVFHEGWWREASQLSRYVGDHVAELMDHPAALERELGRVRKAFGVEASVYGPDGTTLVASSARPPLPPRLEPGASEAAGFPGHSGRGRALPLTGGGQVVFAFRDGHDRPSPRALVVLAAVLGVIALASVPLARSIAAPVERLTRAARALGEGDLSTRARVRARGELGELARAFDEMAERIEAQVRSEKELLANVSHEVRTPLARIRVALELAAEGDLERARRFLGEIGADLDELDRLVEDVLSAARLDLAAHGGGQVRREPVDLPAVLADAGRRFAERWPGRVLRQELGEALPVVLGDGALLRRLLDNLLDNAAKYSGPDAPVVLSARAGAGEALLEVRDRGIGVAPEDLPRLFKPFFRTDRSRARGTGGVGLGLALVRRIARAHGGEVEVESGAETVFRVRLPGN